MMSGCDFLKSQVLSCWRNVESVCDVVISSGRVFQTRGPATVNARSPTVERLTDGTIGRTILCYILGLLTTAINLGYFDCVFGALSLPSPLLIIQLPSVSSIGISSHYVTREIRLPLTNCFHWCSLHTCCPQCLQITFSLGPMIARRKVICKHWGQQVCGEHQWKQSVKGSLISLLKSLNSPIHIQCVPTMLMYGVGDRGVFPFRLIPFRLILALGLGLGLGLGLRL